MASFGIEEPKEDNTLDPMEPVMSMKRGINSVPWHPGTMGPPFVYKVTLLGACGAGKSAVAHRLVAHTFDPTYRATRQPQQHHQRRHGWHEQHRERSGHGRGRGACR